MPLLNVGATRSAEVLSHLRFLPQLEDRIDPFLYTGIGVGWVELTGNSGAGKVDATDFIARFGGGLDLYLTEHLALQVSSSYVLPTGDLDNLAYVSLVFGLQYRWEQPPRP